MIIIAKSDNSTLSKYEVKGKYVPIIKLEFFWYYEFFTHKLITFPSLLWIKERYFDSSIKLRLKW